MVSQGRTSRKVWVPLLLLGVAGLGALLFRVPVYDGSDSVRRAREAVLRDDLFSMRSLIHQYTLDKQKAPQSFQELVSAGYMKEVPKDPFTNSSATWRMTPDGEVHSGAVGVGRDGKPYSSW